MASTLKIDFGKIKEHLDNTLNQSWSIPIVKNVVPDHLLDKDSTLPAYVPMETFFKANNAPLTENYRDRLRTKDKNGDITHLPIICTQLARASEFLLHSEDHEFLDGQNVRRCMPREVAQYATFGFDTQYFQSSISSLFRKLSSDSVTKIINLTRAITLHHIEDKEFIAAMEGSEKERLLWFRDHITTNDIYHIWASQWKAVSFSYVFHRGTRPDESEEIIHIGLYKSITYTAAAVCSMTFEHIIQIKCTDQGTPDEKEGRKIVAQNYMRIREWKAIAKWRIEVEKLPAVGDFFRARTSHGKSALVALPNVDDLE